MTFLWPRIGEKQEDTSNFIGFSVLLTFFYELEQVSFGLYWKRRVISIFVNRQRLSCPDPVFRKFEAQVTGLGIEIVENNLDYLS